MNEMVLFEFNVYRKVISLKDQGQIKQDLINEINYTKKTRGGGNFQSEIITDK